MDNPTNLVDPSGLHDYCFGIACQSGNASGDPTISYYVDVGGSSPLPMKVNVFVEDYPESICVHVHIRRAPETIGEDRYRKRWNKRTNNPWRENPWSEPGEPDGWRYPNLAMLLNGCDGNNSYGGSYEGHEDDDYLILRLTTYASSGKACGSDETKCWHSVGGNGGENSLLHVAGSSKVCAPKCDCCGSFQINMFYPKQDNYPLVSMGMITGEYCPEIKNPLTNETANIYEPSR